MGPSTSSCMRPRRTSEPDHTHGLPARRRGWQRDFRAGGPGPLGGLGALIIILAAGCDNVSWGGLDFDVVPPPERAPPVVAAESDETAPRDIVLPTDPVLFLARSDDAGARLLPLAAVGADGFASLHADDLPEGFWRRFITERMRQGSEYTLYLDGRRAGTFVLSGAEVAAETGCPAIAIGTGEAELADPVPRDGTFLALPEGTLPPALDPAPDSATRVALEARHRRLGPILAERLLRARGAGLPGNWQAALAQARAFPTPEGSRGLVATLMVGDTLGPGLDDQGYALFFLATPSADRSGTGLDTVYTAFADYPATGKAAPEVVDYLDWDRDGWPAFVLEVYGTVGRRFDMLVRDDEGAWARTPLLSCGL